MVTLAHLAREEVEDARGHWTDLEALLVEQPALATERVRTLCEEARARLQEVR